MITIIVTRDDDVTDEFRFDDSLDRIRIGRRGDNDVVVPCRSVSTRHAMLHLHGREMRFADLDSTNGTWQQGRRITEAVLAHGDELRLGQCRLTFLRNTAPATPGRNERLDSTQRLDEEAVAATAESVEIAARRRSSGSVRKAEHGKRRLQAVTVDGDDEPDEQDLPDALGPYAARIAQRQEVEQVEAVGEDAPRRRFDDPSGDDDGASGEARDFETWLAAGDVLVRETLASDDTAEAGRGAPGGRIGTDPLAHGLDAVEALLEPDDATDRHVLAHDAAAVGSDLASIDIMNGAKAGQTMPIRKSVTTLGRPGIQIAAIMRRPDGYYFMHVESDAHVEHPTLNLQPIGDDPVPLQDGDDMQVAGVVVQFRLDRQETGHSTDSDRRDRTRS